MRYSQPRQTLARARPAIKAPAPENGAAQTGAANADAAPGGVAAADFPPDFLSEAWPNGEGPPGVSLVADQNTAVKTKGSGPQVSPEQLVPFFAAEANDTNRTRQVIFVPFVPPMRQGSSATYNRH